MNVLVTGAGGFIGQSLVPLLRARGLNVRTAGREAEFHIADIGPHTDWSAALKGVDAVVHLAGLAHVPPAGDTSQEAAFQRVNVQGVRALLSQAIEAGINTFVHLSSATVMGRDSGKAAWQESDTPAPHNAYARSKLVSEAVVAELAQAACIRYAILRPPLVYGPQVKANFQRLIRLAASGLPLPLASIKNSRDMMGVEQLGAYIFQALSTSVWPSGVYFVSDGQPLATPELLMRLRASMGQPHRLFHCPTSMLKLAAHLLGRGEEIQRLCGNFRVDISHAQRFLTVAPPDMADALQRTVESYQQTRKNA
ncbi:MAG: NAD-dependent epimerase/dehydratase family protein [Rickettsiales bacterium]|nr:NAD-dependent epimerase/dehydratase family protein [Rickettsiales bacterium]